LQTTNFSFDTYPNTAKSSTFKKHPKFDQSYEIFELASRYHA